MQAVISINLYSYLKIKYNKNKKELLINNYHIKIFTAKSFFVLKKYVLADEFVGGFPTPDLKQDLF